MKYTDKFLKLPVMMHNRKEAEITGNEEASEFEGVINFLPSEICHYGPDYDENESDNNRTILATKAGKEIIVMLSVEEFERLLNTYY